MTAVPPLRAMFAAAVWVISTRMAVSLCHIANESPLAESEQVFDTREMGAGHARNLAVETLDGAHQAARRARLELVAERVAPLALAREQTLPVHDALTSLFPDGAVRRGSVVGIGGVGATSLALAVAAGPSVAGSWTAFVGGADIGLVAAGEHGVVLERVLVVDPEPSAWSGALAALIGAVDVIVISPRHRIREPDARRIGSRLRERGSVLVSIGASWPIGADVQLDVAESRWCGIGVGHGVLQSRSVSIAGSGRGAAARPRSLDLLLPGPGGAPVSLDQAS